MTEKKELLPELIKKEISLHFEPSEKITKFVCARRKSARNNVYIVLTNISVFFYGSENTKAPVIALLARKKIKEIEYLQRLSDVLITFIPFGDIKNAVRVKFLNEQRQEIDDFCEDFADIISFKKETLSGIKTIIPAKRKPDETKLPAGYYEGPVLLHAASAIPRPELKAKQLKTNKDKQQEIKAKAEEQEIAKKIEAIPPKIVNAPPPLPKKAVNDKALLIFCFRENKVFISTFISVLVAFLWYEFFYKLSKRTFL